MEPNVDSKKDVDSKEMPESRPMNGGDGPNSYAQNSCYQEYIRGVIDAAKGVIFQAIAEHLDMMKVEPNCFDCNGKALVFRMADFGCSTGPNTFIAMQNVVEAVELKYQQQQQQQQFSSSSLSSSSSAAAAAEFHVFFNDHVDNDFNILFKSLPPSPQYFAAGVPGSFYGRLFPKASLHLVHSSYALHWLTKVPREVVDKNSPAWNKGKIHYTGTDKQVSSAYFGQFQKDLGAFLKARAEELVEGGLMVIQLPGIPNGAVFTQTGAGMIHALLGSCLVDMANMGIISEDSVDSFNLPQYHPSIEELEMLIEMNECFSIERMGTMSHPMKHLPFDVKKTSTQVRAIMEGLVTQHFGNQINVDHLFHLFTNKLQDNYSIFDKEIYKDADLFIVLKRNQNH